MKAVGALVLLAALAGCQSAGNALPETVHWTGQYDVPLDKMVTCLSANAVEPGAAPPQVTRQNGIVHIMLAPAGLSSAGAGEYTVRSLGDGKTQVDWQRVQPAGTGTYFRDWTNNVAGRCGKIYSDFGSGAYGLHH